MKKGSWLKKIMASGFEGKNKTLFLKHASSSRDSYVSCCMKPEFFLFACTWLASNHPFQSKIIAMMHGIR